jgi:hypothetical protein
MSRTLQNLDGRRFGRWVVIAEGPRGHIGKDRTVGIRRMWCLCDCGNTSLVQISHLTSGASKSCGCYNKEHGGAHLVKHRAAGTPEYNIWVGMKDRCSRKASKAYKDYGGRGVLVDPEWENDFVAFFRDMGPRPTPSHSLDRIDPFGHYTKSNCRWATRLEQNRNRRLTKRYTFQGETLTLPEWAERCGLSASCLRGRLGKLGWTVEEALTTPLGPTSPYYR